MVASTARISGSENASLRSRARSAALAPNSLVVGYSTGTKPVSSRNRCIACSWTAGATPGAAKEGDSTATLSPGRALAGFRISRTASVNPLAAPAATAFIVGASAPRWAGAGVRG